MSLLNEIDETAIIHPSAELGVGNVIAPNVYIGPGVKIGDYNFIGVGSVIGGLPEHRDYWRGGGSGVTIGSHNFISNLCTIDQGTVDRTLVGNLCMFLRGCHVGHDAVVADRVTLSCNALVGGHVHVMQGANCGMASVIHQGMVVGAYAMLGMGAVVTKTTEIAPWNVYVGNPARLLKRNDHGIEKAQLSMIERKALDEEYEELRR
jgi:UDP-N-acetylglucosamine acyltransferase